MTFLCNFLLLITLGCLLIEWERPRHYTRTGHDSVMSLFRSRFILYLINSAESDFRGFKKIRPASVISCPPSTNPLPWHDILSFVTQATRVSSEMREKEWRETYEETECRNLFWMMKSEIVWQCSRSKLLQRISAFFFFSFLKTFWGKNWSELIQPEPFIKFIKNIKN